MPLLLSNDYTRIFHIICSLILREQINPVVVCLFLFCFQVKMILDLG